MKYIQKGASPQSLNNFKNTPGNTFNELDHYSWIKRELKAKLISEQGALCCYCGRRINFSSSVIEHFKPKSIFPDLQLEYSNLLSSCMGGSVERANGKRYQNKKFPLSCDAKKKNREIAICPTDPNCERYFMYDDDGNIYGTNNDAKQVIEILGLNNGVLKNARKAAIDYYVNLPTDTDWKVVINRLSSKKEDVFLEYCFAVIYYIKNFKM